MNEKAVFVSVSTDNILKWICVVKLIFVNECDLAHADLETSLPLQTMHINVHTRHFSKLC
jgi:hypothetical protein